MGTNSNTSSSQPGYPDLSRLAYAKPYVFCGNSQRVQGTTSDSPMQVVAPGPGRVAIITKICGNIAGARGNQGGTAPYVRTFESPEDGRVARLAFRNIATASPAYMPILCWDKASEVDGTPAVSAIPDAPLVWEPRHPIVVPESWDMSLWTNTSNGSGLMAYGYTLETQDARAMGFPVGNEQSPIGAPFKELVYDGAVVSDATVDLVPAVPGFSIQILDILVRLQPNALGGAAITIADESGTIFKFVNDNMRTHGEWKFSPGLYARASEKLTVTGDAQSEGRGTVAIIARYVPNDEVPGDHFWSYLDPAVPSPDSLAGILQTIKRESSTFTLNYPRRAETETTPGNGRRHHVEGFTISASKDSTATSDLLWFAITTGAASDSVKHELAESTTSNDLICPPVQLGGPYQGATLTVDNINVPCRPNDGQILFEALATAGTLLLTPAGEGDVRDWSATIWGRTLPTEQPTSPNPHFFGGTT